MENPPFVKKFDFRGVYNKDIFDKDSFYVTLSLCELFKPKKVLLGWDTRVSSKNLATAAIEALQNKGVEIYYLDNVPIDYVTAAAFASDFDFSIMFTGSHNTWDWSGMLIHEKGGKSLSSQNVESVVREYNKLLNSIPYTFNEIHLENYKNFEQEIENIYSEKIKSLIPLAEIKPQTILVDIGDGSGSTSLSLLEKLLPQIKVTRICDRKLYDGNSMHTADPSELKNMEHIMLEMKNKNFDSGFVFDSDGDRVLAVDEKLNYLNGSVLASGLIQAFSMLSLPDNKVGYAVECGPSFYNTVVDLNKTAKDPISIQPIPVGRSLVRGMVFDSKIDFGFENVGHFYIKDFFMTDSAVFVMCCILYWTSVNGKLSKLLEKHPDGLRLQGSQKVTSDLEVQNQKIEKEIFQKYEDREIKKIGVDGTRLELFENEYMSAWITFRRSGYEHLEKYYCGALHKNDFDFLDHLLKTFKE